MSIRTSQIQRALEGVVRSLYSQGVQPTFSEIMSRLGRFFSTYPTGRPLPVPLRNAAVPNRTSNVDQYNEWLEHIAINLDVLYEASLDQVQEILQLSGSLQSYLHRLEAYRRRIETRIDDYLLSQFNTDGYYYSVSDNFSDADMTDLLMTSAQIDTTVGVCLLPTVSSMTKRIPLSSVGQPLINVSTPGNTNQQYVEIAPFAGAIEDSLQNIIWAIEVETATPTEVIATVDVPLGDGIDPVILSRIDFMPYGVSPVQMWVETYDATLAQPSGLSVFSNQIQTSTHKMIFNDERREITGVRFTLRKTQPDYRDMSTDNVRYRYILGAREITFLQQVYENVATFVSKPLYLPDEAENELVIDAVSLAVEQDVPADTELDFYVASSNGVEDSVDDLAWRPILPIDSGEPGDKLVRFNGANLIQRNIVEDATGGDLELISPNTSGPLPGWNPTPSIIPGVDVYRLAAFAEEPMINSLSLVEGVNTTRIYSKTYDANAISGLEYWADELAGPDNTLTIDYGRIDTGAEFFYGGDVGASGRSIYVETYVDSPESRPTFLKEFQKVDERARHWDVKIFLNGRQLGHLPPNTDRAQLPWAFRQGRNHVALIVNIPLTGPVPDLYTGVVSLFGDTDLYAYGEVNLGVWSYVDFFTMQYGESGQPHTFTLHNGEIISRRKPTTNYRLQYALSNGQGPQAVRLRADLNRRNNNPYVSPMLGSYRLRFQYSGDYAAALTTGEGA